MCGILLLRKEDSNESRINSISHRGIEHSIENTQSHLLCHHRLPIQTSDGDNWNQPIELSPGIYLMFNGKILIMIEIIFLPILNIYAVFFQE